MLNRYNGLIFDLTNLTKKNQEKSDFTLQERFLPLVQLRKQFPLIYTLLLTYYHWRHSVTQLVLLLPIWNPNQITLTKSNSSRNPNNGIWMVVFIEILITILSSLQSSSTFQVSFSFVTWNGLGWKRWSHTRTWLLFTMDILLTKWRMKMMMLPYKEMMTAKWKGRCRNGKTFAVLLITSMCTSVDLSLLVIRHLRILSYSFFPNLFPQILLFFFAWTQPIIL